MTPPVPPDIDMNEAKYWERAWASWSVKSAPALTPPVATQLGCTLNCCAMHAYMSSKNLNSSSKRGCGSRTAYGHFSSRSSLASGNTAMKRS